MKAYLTWECGDSLNMMLPYTGCRINCVNDFGDVESRLIEFQNVAISRVVSEIFAVEKSLTTLFVHREDGGIRLNPSLFVVPELKKMNKLIKRMFWDDVIDKPTLPPYDLKFYTTSHGGTSTKYWNVDIKCRGIVAQSLFVPAANFGSFISSHREEGTLRRAVTAFNVAMVAMYEGQEPNYKHVFEVAIMEPVERNVFTFLDTPQRIKHILENAIPEWVMDFESIINNHLKEMFVLNQESDNWNDPRHWHHQIKLRRKKIDTTN